MSDAVRLFSADEPVVKPAEHPQELWISAEYIGGDPTLCRVREVSLTIPVGEQPDAAEVAVITTTVFRELRRLADLGSYEDGPRP